MPRDAPVGDRPLNLLTAERSLADASGRNVGLLLQRANKRRRNHDGEEESQGFDPQALLASGSNVSSGWGL